MEENVITSVQNARIKHGVALQQKSSLRREEGLFVVEGQREIEHCIACGYEVTELFVMDNLDYTGFIPAIRVSPQVYEKMAYRGSTEGLIAVAKEAKLRNTAPIKYHIEVAAKYWETIFRAEGITDKTKMQERANTEKQRAPKAPHPHGLTAPPSLKRCGLSAFKSTKRVLLIWEEKPPRLKFGRSPKSVSQACFDEVQCRSVLRCRVAV